MPSPTKRKAGMECEWIYYNKIQIKALEIEQKAIKIYGKSKKCGEGIKEFLQFI